MRTQRLGAASPVDGDDEAESGLASGLDAGECRLELAAACGRMPRCAQADSRVSGSGFACSRSASIASPSIRASIRLSSPARSRIVRVFALADTTAQARPASWAPSR